MPNATMIAMNATGEPMHGTIHGTTRDARQQTALRGAPQSNRTEND
jgi:hypothetical protein